MKKKKIEMKPVKQYSLIIGLEKTLFRTIVIAGPLFVGLLPEAWMNVTLGAIATFCINYAKNRNK